MWLAVRIRSVQLSSYSTSLAVKKVVNLLRQNRRKQQLIFKFYEPLSFNGELEKDEHETNRRKTKLAEIYFLLSRWIG